MSKETPEKISLETSLLSIMGGVLAAGAAGLLLYLPMYGVAMIFHDASLPAQVFVLYPALFIFLYIPALSAGWACANIVPKKEKNHVKALFIILVILITAGLIDSAASRWEDLFTAILILGVGALGLRSGLKIVLKKKQKRKAIGAATEEALPEDAFKID